MTSKGRILEAFLCIFFCTLIAACGGGSGGAPRSVENEPDIPNVPPLEASNAYQPIDSRIRWHYRDINSGNESTWQFSSAGSANGDKVSALNFPDGHKEYFISTPEKLSLAGLYLPAINRAGGTYSADAKFDIPINIVGSGALKAGAGLQLNGTGVATISPQYGNVPITYSGYFSYQRDMAIDTGLGVLTGKKFDLTADISANVGGYHFSIQFWRTYLFVENIGLVNVGETMNNYVLSSVDGMDTSFLQKNDERKLFSNKGAVQFSRMPSSSALTDTLYIKDSQKLNNIPWVASSVV